jgi:hypothetical protein
MTTWGAKLEVSNLGEITQTPTDKNTPQIAYIRVRPRPETELENNDTVMKVTLHYGDTTVTVWSACDEAEQEEDDIRLSRIV